MSRGWPESADPRSGFDAHDETLAPTFTDTASPQLPDHLARAIAFAAQRAAQERAAVDERRRKAVARYEAGVAARAGKYVRDLTAERWSA